MTTGLSDKQLADAFSAACRNALESGEYALSPHGLRAVADLAITHADSEIHALKTELALFQKPDK